MKKEGVIAKIKKGFRLIFSLYLFIFLIELIKKSSMAFAPDLKNLFLYNFPPVKAVCLGWITTSILQSSGATSSTVAAFVANNLLELPLAVYILIGTFLGTTITALLISLITSAKNKRDFRHGFEIALCHSIYSALLIIILFFLEYLFKLFSKASMFLASNLKENISFLNTLPNLVDIITQPVINLLSAHINKFILFVFALAGLVFTLRFISRSVVDVLGGEEPAKRFISRHFSSKYKGYLLGLVLTAIVFSSSITISLLIPLAVSRLINLKKTIPFILGAHVGTSSDVFLASILIGKTTALAVAFSYFMFAVLGSIIFFPNTEFLFKITKFTSKRLIHISRKKALLILLAFLLIPLLIILL